MKDAESAMKWLTDDLLLLLSRKEIGYVLSKSLTLIITCFFGIEAFYYIPSLNITLLIPQVQFLKLLKKPELPEMQSKGTKEKFNGEY